MAQVGFICEGYTESILLESESFKELMIKLNIKIVNVVNAQGSANLLPRNISAFTKRLEEQGAEIIVILTDLDQDVCITKTKQRIAARNEDIVVIAVKEIEAWLLASDTGMQRLLGLSEFRFDFPEKENEPFMTINNLLYENRGKGIGQKRGGKKKLIKRFLANGLDLLEISNHPNCPSAKYFLDKLTELGRQD
jgi:hypothetical protein